MVDPEATAVSLRLPCQLNEGFLSLSRFRHTECNEAGQQRMNSLKHNAIVPERRRLLVTQGFNPRGDARTDALLNPEQLVVWKAAEPNPCAPQLFEPRALKVNF